MKSLGVNQNTSGDNKGKSFMVNYVNLAIEETPFRGYIWGKRNYRFFLLNLQKSTKTAKRILLNMT